MTSNLVNRNNLWYKIETDLLPFIIKPARYTGNELNSIIKPHSRGTLKIALCYPEMYEIGMAYLGMKILYNLINKRDDCLAERVFMVWPDMENRMRELEIPLFSLETSTPLAEFDILGFHMTYEMNNTAVLAMLDLAGIPIYSKDRKESDPLVIAGGPSVMNPEPMADFIDLFYIGDAEESIDEILNIIKSSKQIGKSKEQTLKELSGITGVYIPGFYSAEYDNGEFERLTKLKPDIPETIKVQSSKELKTDHYPERPIVPFIETSQDHLTVEIMRGCVRGCRFCQAGYQYRPRRQRDIESIKSEISSGLEATGYEDVTLLSLSSTDYSELDALIGEICPKLAEQRVSVGLPSLRPETITPGLLNHLSTVRKPGLTLAPEAGTERLRKIAGKDITDDQIYAALETAFKAGWQTVKFYFMIGLPEESADDIEGIAAILRKASYMARQYPGRININVSVSPFCPKSHTPWQWEGLADNDELERKFDKLCKRVKKSNINLKFRDLDLTRIEAAIARGDRRLGEVIYRAYLRGSRLDGWSEFFDPRRWYDAFNESGIDIERYTERLNPESKLPWDHIDKGISKDFLIKDCLDSKKAIPPKTAFSKKSDTRESDGVESSFGRRTRRAVKTATSPKGTYRLRIRYTIGPEMRFLSHLDNIRTIFKAVRRSGIPIAYSEGFNPHLKISFGPPLPVGHTSEAEYCDMILTQPFREEFIKNLSDVMPNGMSLTGHKYFFARQGSLVKQLNLAKYEIPSIDKPGFDQAKVDDLLEKRILKIVRKREKDSKELEVGRFIDDLRIRNDILLADILQTSEGHIKPEELLIFGLGVEEALAKRLKIHRKAQFNKFGGRLIEPLDLV